MRTLLLAALGLFLPTGLLFAQVCPPHPTDPVATLDTSFVATLVIPDLGAVNRSSTEDFTLGSGEPATARAEICVFRKVDGGFDYYVTPGSIAFQPGADVVDEYETRELFGLFAEAAVRQAIDLGKSPCGTPGTYSVKVWSAECVQRSGLGGSTQFAACDGSSSCYRTFSISCTAATSTVTQASSTGATSACSIACDWTCP